MSDAAFDTMAASYDADFTNSAIGKIQRDLVWNRLEPILKTKNLDILELNCGTGEDALYFATLNHRVLATDISSEMIAAAKRKIAEFGKQDQVQCITTPIQQINDFTKGKKFDLVFSNFGGLNCLPPKDIDNFLNLLPDILKPGGTFVAVIMPKYCLFEISTFLLRLKFKKAFRRATNGPVAVNVKNDQQLTWYYNPLFFKRRAQFRNFAFESKPIGFVVPPSNFESFFAKKRTYLHWLYKLEQIVGRFSWLSRFSDHYILQMHMGK